ncbi:MAG: GDSL-type esterase/lipase family protein [Gammaproteobacteria bacterium]
MNERTGSHGRRRIYTVVAIVLPLLLLGAVEGGLRLAGIAEPAPLFIDEPNHPDYRLANPGVIGRYFPDRTAAPGISIETGFFLAEKPANGLRVVVQGGSTAAGFPYGLGASPAGMLERRLRRTYPHRQVEVINTAMSAVNSYTLTDFAGEIIDVGPDLVVIYAGHNEYLGLFGVGSSLSVSVSPWLTRLHLALGDLRLYRLLGRLLAPAAGRVAEGREASRSLMARVAGNRSIPYGSDDYRRGVEQFRHNMSELLERYRSAGIPVFVGTLVANEKDQPPFASAPPRLEELEASALADVDELRMMLEAAPDSADIWYALGQRLLSMGRDSAAREAFLAAKDRDRLRFRAPEEFNTVLREVAAATDATLVDVQRTLALASPDRIVGATLMLEHLHPTLEGYFLLADAYYDAIVESGLIGEPTRPISEAMARAEVPVSAVDRLFGEYKAARVVNDWPFVQQPTDPGLPEPAGFPEELALALYEQRIAWPEATLRLRDHYRGRDAAEYLRVSLILADAFPFLPDLQRQAATLLLRSDRVREGLNHAYRAASRSPRDPPSLLVLAEAFARLGQTEEADQVLARVLAVDPDNARALRARRLLAQDAAP